jgi:hypothetical protein
MTFIMKLLSQTNEKGLILRYNALDVKEYHQRHLNLFQGCCNPFRRRIDYEYGEQN